MTAKNDTQAPLVSVIIPTYNRAELVLNAIKTVQNQSYTNWELIVVDDASTDDTLEQLKSINDERLRIIRHHENKGGSAARNSGIKVAKGKYIAPLDSDDEWSVNKLAKQVAVAENAPEDVAGIYCDRELRSHSPDGTNKRISNIEAVYHLTKKFLLGNYIGGASVLLLKKEALETVGLFDPRCKAKQDTDLWLRLSLNYGFMHAPDCLVINHTQHSDRISSHSSSTIDGRIYFYNKHQRLFKEHGLEHVYLRKTARFIIANGGGKNLAYRYLWKGMRVKPFYIYAYLYAIKMLFMRR